MQEFGELESEGRLVAYTDGSAKRVTGRMHLVRGGGCPQLCRSRTAP